MDPLFERRQLVRNIHIDARDLQRNIQASILAQLRLKYEGICVAEGYIQRQSIQIVEYSLGRANLIKGGLDYTVKFQADVCMPHQGQKFKVPVVLKSKIGIHAEITPLKILLPRDLHIGLDTFENVEEKQEVEIEVIGAKYQQGDDTIVVLGKLLATVEEKPPVFEETIETNTSEPLIAAETKPSSSEEKRMVTVNVESAKVSEPTRKRIRKPTANKDTNE